MEKEEGEFWCMTVLIRDCSCLREKETLSGESGISSLTINFPCHVSLLISLEIIVTKLFIQVKNVTIYHNRPQNYSSRLKTFQLSIG